MRLAPLRSALLSLCAAALLCACHGKSEPGGRSPEAAVRDSVDLIKAGDFNGLWRHALPPTDYANLRADWTHHQQQQPPITAADRANFDKTLQQLTAPDAEARLDAELQPKLATMEQQYKDQLPVLISVGTALVKSRIEQSEALGTEQKTQAAAVLGVLGNWAQQTPWFDQAKARQAVAIVVATARKLDLKSPEQLRSLDFDASMAKYATGFDGLKQFLALYGLSVNDALNSIKLSTVSNKDGHAVVRIDYTLFGHALSTDTTLVELDGRWYGEEMLNSAREAHRKAGLVPATAATIRVAKD